MQTPPGIWACHVFGVCLSNALFVRLICSLVLSLFLSDQSPFLFFPGIFFAKKEIVWQGKCLWSSAQFPTFFSSYSFEPHGRSAVVKVAVTQITDLLYFLFSVFFLAGLDFYQMRAAPFNPLYFVKEAVAAILFLRNIEFLKKKAFLAGRKEFLPFFFSYCLLS